MPLTDAITDAVRKKISSLEKIIRTNGFIQVDLGKPSAHHKGGMDVFVTEITLDANGVMYYVKATSADLYASLDNAVRDIEEAIKQGRGKRHTLARKGRIALKQLLKTGF